MAGRYLLLEELGRGATGTVHRVLDLAVGRELAGKVLRSSDPEAVAGFVRESAHRIDHPHVAAPLGWVAEADTVLILMELARGGSVRDLLAERGRLPAGTVAVLLSQLLDALATVHAHGVVHGDVKPANLLLDRPTPAPLHLRLADFGAAAAAPPTRERPPHERPPAPGDAAAVWGTPTFLAPERLAGAGPHPSQDVYAAGLMARRVLAGESPLLTLCSSMTRPEPDRRPSAAAARRRLRELLGGPQRPC